MPSEGPARQNCSPRRHGDTEKKWFGNSGSEIYRGFARMNADWLVVVPGHGLLSGRSGATIKTTLTFSWRMPLIQTNSWRYEFAQPVGTAVRREHNCSGREQKP